MGSVGLEDPVEGGPPPRVGGRRPRRPPGPAAVEVHATLPTPPPPPHLEGGGGKRGLHPPSPHIYRTLSFSPHTRRVPCWHGHGRPACQWRPLRTWPAASPSHRPPFRSPVAPYRLSRRGRHRGWPAAPLTGWGPERAPTAVALGCARAGAPATALPRPAWHEIPGAVAAAALPNGPPSGRGDADGGADAGGGE